MVTSSSCRIICVQNNRSHNTATGSNVDCDEYAGNSVTSPDRTHRKLEAPLKPNQPKPQNEMCQAFAKREWRNRHVDYPAILDRICQAWRPTESQTGTKASPNRQQSEQCGTGKKSAEAQDRPSQPKHPIPRNRDRIQNTGRIAVKIRKGHSIERSASCTDTMELRLLPQKHHLGKEQFRGFPE